MTTSLPATRSTTPAQDVKRMATPPPASKPIPQDFRSSLAAWWNNASYKEARYAEERLLRRMAAFEPSPSSPEEVKGWFGWGSTSQTAAKQDPQSHGASAEGLARSVSRTTASQLNEAEQNRAGEEVSLPVGIGSTNLIATIKNVFIPTPNPDHAPAHPADPVEPSVSAEFGTTASASSSTSSLSGEKSKSKVKCHKVKDDKLVDYLNTLEISTPENANSKEAVVMLHGYAAALGFFFRNWEAVATTANDTGRRTFFLDWLGMGLSSRPSPKLLDSPSSVETPARVARAEHFFLSSLESWRASVGLEKMVLVGHSLGGYLASAYTARYPDRVSALILVSPAGIPHGPEYKRYQTSAELAAGKTRTVGVNADGAGVGEGREEAAEAVDAELNKTQPEAKGEAKQWQKDQTLTRKYMMKFFVWGWEKGLSPFSILRNMGPYGPLFASRYTQRRFASQSEEDRRDIHAYIYNTSILKGSGEFCISHILAPGAYARIPILDRIGQVKVPVTFMYGDNDWMDVDGGKDAVRELEKAGNKNASVHVVPKAGHHLYLDNPEYTNKLLDDAIKALPKVSVAQR